MEFHENNLDYTHMEWPPYNQDLNPIEQAWDMLGSVVSQVNPKLATKEELLLDLQVQWNTIHQMKIRKLIVSALVPNGGPTHY